MSDAPLGLGWWIASDGKWYPPHLHPHDTSQPEAGSHCIEEARPASALMNQHDFGDDQGPVPAHQHENGGGWVADSATVAQSAFVGPAAGVFDMAKVLGHASVTDTAWVRGEAEVGDFARIGGDSVVDGNARVCDHAEVVGNAYVSGEAVLLGNDRVGGDEESVERFSVGSGDRWGADPTLDGDDELVDPVGTEDSAFGRIRWGWPGPRVISNSVLRRLQGWELVLILLLFPAGSAIQAVVALIQRIQTQTPVTSNYIPLVHGAWLAVGLTVMRAVPNLAVAAMVLYLLVRSGEGVRAINLDPPRFRMDLALLLPVFVIVFWIPQVFGQHLLVWIHLQGFLLFPTPIQLPMSALTIAQVAISIQAGILEEVVVLGYLVRRLEQRGYSSTAVVAIAVAVRISYHLYYGWNVLPIALWALVSVLAYRRVRRLLPFILCHIAWDAALPFRAFYPSTYQVMWLLALVATLGMAQRWGRWNPSKSEPVPHSAMERL